MKDLKTKKEGEDLPANKPRVNAQDKSKTGDEPMDRGNGEMKTPGELERMKSRLDATTDPTERKMILNSIQQQFGNAVAEKIVTKLRLKKDKVKEDEEKEG
jgi:hypothetical protein